MATIDPSLFYTGLVAALYEDLRSAIPDPEPYVRFVRAWGEPALELGCGAGDPLLTLRSQGLDVEGLDSSPDMLERCRRTARDRGVDVVLHEQTMQAMNLHRRYRSIYLAGPTFNLLPNDNDALLALQRIRSHLERDGSALVPLMVPSPTPAKQIGQTREYTEPDGRRMRVSTTAEERDEDARWQIATLRYELESDDMSLVEERQWLLHWYTQSQFRELAASAQLDVRAILAPSGGPAREDADAFVFLLTNANPGDVTIGSSPG